MNSYERNPEIIHTGETSLYKKKEDNIQKKRIRHCIEINIPEDDEINNQFIDDSYKQDPNRIFLDLQASNETLILKSYSNLNILCKNDPDFNFPNENFDIVLNHTLSENPTIAEHSQGFLTFFFRKHPVETQIFLQIDKQEYFNNLISSTFSSLTVPYLITSLTDNSLQEVEFLDIFFDTFFSQIDCDIQSPNFYNRLEFLRIFILKFLPNKKNVKFRLSIYESCQNFVLTYFPQISHFDEDLLYSFLFIMSYCMNIETDEKWLIEFINNNYISVLLSFYSDGNDKINYCIIWALCGISGSSSDISDSLFSYNLLDFFGNNFFNSKDEKIQALFIRVILNMLKCDILSKKGFTNDFIESQIFQDIIDSFEDASFPIKVEIIGLVCFIVTKLRDDFIPQFVESNLISLFIDALYFEEDAEDTKNYVIEATATIVNIYNLIKDDDDQLAEMIESILMNMDFVEAIDDYINEADQSNPTDALAYALNIHITLYKMNGLSS